MIQNNVKQQQLGRPTSLEVAGYALLDELGVSYEKQAFLCGKFLVDAWVPTKTTVVQFDGDYWHGNPAMFPTLDGRQQKRARLDQSQDAYFKKCGYPVVRLWESDFKTRPDFVRDQLSKLVEEQKV